MDEPEVGERRAHTFHGHVAFGDGYQPPADATWTVEEWDGTTWRKVGVAKGDAERDRMLRLGA